MQAHTLWLWLISVVWSLPWMSMDCSIYHILRTLTMLIGWYVWELSQSLGMSNKLGFNNFRGTGNNFPIICNPYLCPFWIFKILNKLQFHPDNPFVWDHICRDAQLFKKHEWLRIELLGNVKEKKYCINQFWGTNYQIK